MIKLRFDTDNSPLPSPIFTGELNSGKFGLILAFDLLQFRNEAMYLTPNTNYGSIPGTDPGICERGRLPSPSFLASPHPACVLSWSETRKSPAGARVKVPIGDIYYLL